MCTGQKMSYLDPERGFDIFSTHPRTHMELHIAPDLQGEFFFTGSVHVFYGARAGPRSP